MGEVVGNWSGWSQLSENGGLTVSLFATLLAKCSDRSPTLASSFPCTQIGVLVQLMQEERQLVKDEGQLLKPEMKPERQHQAVTTHRRDAGQPMACLSSGGDKQRDHESIAGPYYTQRAGWADREDATRQHAQKGPDEISAQQRRQRTSDGYREGQEPPYTFEYYQDAYAVSEMPTMTPPDQQLHESQLHEKWLRQQQQRLAERLHGEVRDGLDSPSSAAFVGFKSGATWASPSR